MKTAIILAGGMGSRMGSLTNSKPKCLLKIGGFTILSHLYTQLRIAKINKVIICTGYLNQKINSFCETRIYKESDLIFKKLKKNFLAYPIIKLSKHNINASTSQRLIKARKFFESENKFLLLYGDTFLKPNLKNLNKNFKSDKFSLILTISNPPSAFGVVKTKLNYVVSFEEKQILKQIWVNSGWTMIKSEFIDRLENNRINYENYMFSKSKIKKSIGFTKNRGFYLPVDRAEDLKKASYIFEKNISAWF